MKSFIYIILSVIMLFCSQVNAQEVYISSFDGEWGEAGVLPGVPVTWTININTTPDGIMGSTNGFRVFLSSDGTPEGMLDPGPGFTPITYSTLVEFSTYVVYTEQPFSIDGFGADTIGFGGLSFSDPVVIINEPTWTITTQVDSLLDTYLCIDSSFFPPGGAWLWSTSTSGNIYPTWTGTQCWLIKEYCIPAEFTSPPESLSFPNHCTEATYQFHASDPDPEECDPPGDGSVYFSMVDDDGSGSTITPDGFWSMNPTIDDHNNSPYSIVIRVDDACGCGEDFSFDVSFGNNSPSIDCGSGTTVCNLSSISPYQVIASDPDECDELTFSLISSTAQGLASIDPITGIFNFQSDSTDVGFQTFTIEVSDGSETALCDIIIEVLNCDSFYEIRIEESQDTYIYEKYHAFVDLSVNIGSLNMWGFEFLLSFDASILSFQALLRGSIYSNCGWEYLTYSIGKTSNVGNQDPSGLLRVIGIADINNNIIIPDCFNPYNETLFTLDFLVTQSLSFDRISTPISFYWEDCNDNTVLYHELTDIENPYSQTLGISRRVYDYNGIEITDFDYELPGYFGAPTIPCMDSVNDVPVRFIDLFNGMIDLNYINTINDRGDLNLNGIANEVADAILYTDVLINGPVMFVAPGPQTAASDVNADGIVLSVGDLVYLIRIIIGDAQPFPKLNPIHSSYSIENGILSVQDEMGAVFITVNGNTAPTLVAENMELKYYYDTKQDITRILVYSMEQGQTFSGEFLADVSNNINSIEFATYDGTSVKLESLPGDFVLNQNYPNPFNPVTTISFEIPVNSEYELIIYNTLGQTVKSYKGIAKSTITELEWDASDYPSGVFYYRLSTGVMSDQKKMVLIK